ncbi:MAG: hypothetical protein MUP47_02565 [Phycisphaerae bacterium]|nr:hypothetical protein [Phycisphaerae bacterium]
MAVLATLLASACLWDNACEAPTQPEGTDLVVRIVLPEGQLAYLSKPPMISIQAHRYIHWRFGRPEGDIGTVHPNAVVATSIEGPLQFAVAIDADKPDAPQPTLLRVNTSGKLDFRQAAVIPLTPRSPQGGAATSYAAGPGAATLQVDGQTIPVTLHGEYEHSLGSRYLKLGLECVLQGACRFGNRVLAVRIADGDGNGRIGDLVLPMLRSGAVIGRTPGYTVNIDLGDGSFAKKTSLIRTMYGQPVYIDGAWWDLRVSSDRRSVFAHRLGEGTGRVRIRNAHWEAMFLGANHVFRQHYDPSAESFPLPPGRYVVMRYKQWAEADMKDDKPAVLIEPPFPRNGPFLLKGDEASFEVLRDKTLDLPVGTPFQANLKVTGDDRSRQYRVSYRVTDASSSTPAYIRTAADRPVRVAVTVSDRDGAKLSQVDMSHQADMKAEGQWNAPADAKGPFTAVATMECGDFAADTQRVTFGPPAAERVAATPPPGGPTPKGSSLEFHIAPTPADRTRVPMFPGSPAELPTVPQLLKELQEQGPQPAQRRNDAYQWFEMAGGVEMPQAITGEHGGRRYVLLAALEPFGMLRKDAGDPWGVRSARPCLDHANRPAVAFELDERGGQLFSDLTGSNLDNTLAILVDGKVVAAPIIRARLERQGIISGRFTQEQAAELARALELGMRPGAGAETAGALSATVTPVTGDPSQHTYAWRIQRKTPARMVYGVLEDVGSRNPTCVVAAYEGRAESIVKDYTLTLTREKDTLKGEIRDEYHPAEAGSKGAVWNSIPWPKGTELTDVWEAAPSELTHKSYLTLWEGTFLRNGKAVKHLVLVARLATPQDPVASILGEGDAVKDIVGPRQTPPSPQPRGR